MISIWYLPRLSLSRIACLVLATFHPSERKVCHVMQLMLMFLISETSWQLKTATAIRKNENWMLYGWFPELKDRYLISVCHLHKYWEFRARDGMGAGWDTWHDCNRGCHQGFESSWFKGTTPGDNIQYKRDPMGLCEYLSLQSFQWQMNSLLLLLNWVQLEW